MAANDTQVGGNHYGLQDFQHWDMVVHFKLDYFQGQITKYVMRWREKGGIQDLKKAQHFLAKYIEVATQQEVAKVADDFKATGWVIKFFVIFGVWSLCYVWFYTDEPYGLFRCLALCSVGHWLGYWWATQRNKRTS